MSTYNYFKIFVALVLFALMLGCIGGKTPKTGTGIADGSGGTAVPSAKVAVQESDITDPEDPGLDVPDLAAEELGEP